MAFSRLTWQSFPCSPNVVTCRGKSDRALGKPKKGGAGGKFNWGAKMDFDVSSTTKDPHDPNYDSAEEIDEHLQLRPSATQCPATNKQVDVLGLQLSLLALSVSLTVQLPPAVALK